MSYTTNKRLDNKSDKLDHDTTSKTIYQTTKNYTEQNKNRNTKVSSQHIK